MKRLSHIISFLVITSAVILIASSPADATWRLIYRNPTPLRVGSFVDERFGVVGGEAQWGTFVTRDTGKTWSNVMLPGSPVGFITQIKMIDATTGWLTVEGDGSKPCLYQTTDGANSWVANSLIGIATDVYLNGNNIVLTSRFQAGSGWLSIDRGASWTHNNLNQSMGIDFVDSLHGVVTGFMAADWYRTVDGGVTWTQLAPAETIESWSVYAVKGSANFYTAGEGDFSNLAHVPSSVMRSSDYGATWEKMTNLSFRTTGHIAGVGETLYVQASRDTSINIGVQGVYRSMDKGRTWTSVGGPSNQVDTHFTVMGANANIIVAFDDKGGVWTTDDGGDGALANPLSVDNNMQGISASQITGVFPNPMSSSSESGEIVFETKDRGEARLTIENALGMTVATLAERTMDGGVHSEHFSLTGMPPGVYYAVLTTTDTRSVRKIVVW